MGFTNSPLRVRRPATPDLAGWYTNNYTLSRGTQPSPVSPANIAAVVCTYKSHDHFASNL